ncbi:beta-lactamase [Chryseobacterium soli]|uniref:beta-lactamase n=1 Tax=Chryseobacterium soli TaxID=445961 RepID=A0A086AA43_9FLAO|nr:subclass B1 metallo-beta-lactamase [Chryseobacterium soli]KFF13557.1 beta-lactamase [Chryseobacterium soli]
MKLIIRTLFIIVCSLTVLNCNSQKKESFQPKVVYQSNDLTITQISENSYEHTSYLKTQDFGNVSCNGLIVRNNNETIIFDTTTKDKSSEELIQWVTGTLNCKIKAIIPTHFHEDCLGGLKAFDDHHIPSYASVKTVELAKEHHVTVPKNSFNDAMVLKLGNKDVIARFFGEGHTKDNVIGYFPSENIMFGGCLIKEINATKGYLGDANVTAWSGTVEKIKKQYPNVKIIIPGHGDYGNSKLLEYTINLFKTK